MNEFRRLWGAASATTTVEQRVTSPVYDPTPATTWSPQMTNGPNFASASSSSNSRPARTPSPPALGKLSIQSNGISPVRLPSRQNSNPVSPDDSRAPSRRTNSVNSVRSHSSNPKSKYHPPGHSKATSSFSRSLANGMLSPPVPGSTAANTTKDELIIELLASEAVVDSREYDILGAEQVEELKKELKSLSIRVNAAAKKVTTETKIRDAALALNKVHKRVPSKAANGATTSSLDAANLKVQNAQLELSKLSERYNQVHQQLLEHRSAVLSYSLSRLESLLKPPAASSDNTSGRTTPANGGGMNGYAGGDFSPTSAVTNMSLATRQKFEGAHLFAGHADAKAPKVSKSHAQVSAMEEQLASVEEALNAAKAEEEALRREAATLRSEKDSVKSQLDSKLQEADNTIFGLRSELSRMNSTAKRLRQLEDEKRQWEDDKTRMEKDLKEKELSGNIQADLDPKEHEIRRLQSLLEQERRERESDRIAWEDEKMEDMARLQQEMEDQRAKDSGADVELDMAAERLQALIRTHNISLSPSQRRDMSVLTLINALGSSLDSVKEDSKSRQLEKEEWESTKRRLENELKASLERRDKLSQDIEDARQERESARNQVRLLEDQVREAQRLDRPIPSKSGSLSSDPGSSNGSRTSEDMDRVMSTLRSLWALLPSREARTAKSNARAGSPTSPLRPGGSRLGEPSSPALSDLDVRALKALYDPRSNAQSPLFNNLSNPADFTIESFAQRVQALVADDRAIIERLLRFAQAHDLLKNNAERAQKLAQESSMGLETYQKQVKALEERNATLVTKQSDLMDEINTLQNAAERAQREKRQFEMKYQDQAVTLQNLKDANSTLSARTLALAEEVATAPESMRIKMEAQLIEVRRQLKESLDEIEAMRSSEQGQKAALLEELNGVQGEVIKLRDELRVEKRKNGGK